MKAYVFSAWEQNASLVEVDKPEPGHGEVLIKVGGAGACHSDLHIMHEWTPDNFPSVASWELPFTLGHENAGWIESGDIPPGMEAGMPVVISPTWSCGICNPCRGSETNYCEQEPVHAGGLGRNGGLAEYLVAPADTLIALDKLEPWQAAPLTDAGLTSYHAVRRVLPVLYPGSVVVVIGIGGLGHLAVEYLRELSGSTIIAVDHSEAALQMASDLGAHICLPSDGNTAAAVLKATRGLGVMAVLDFVGIDATMQMAAQVVRKRGQVVVAGLGGGVLPFHVGALPFGCALSMVLGGSTRELTEVVALAEAGRIHPHIEKFSLDQVDEVYRKLENHEIKGRAVLIP